MFENSALEELQNSHSATFETLRALEKELAGRFFGMEKSIACMMLASLTGEAMVMIGPPGTAKSRLIRSYCDLLGLLGETAPDQTDGETRMHKKEAYFEYLLTQFTEPSELFGYYDLGLLFGDEKKLERDAGGMMQRAKVVFLDEVFNASSAILNALLTFMNEKKFHDRGQVYQVPMRLLFAATNHPPREEGLAAFYDRFLLRDRLENVSSDPERLAEFMSAAWTESHGGAATAADRRRRFEGLLDGLDAYRADVGRLTADGTLRIDENSDQFRTLADMVAGLRRNDLSQMSNRRLVKFAGVILARALLRTPQGDRVEIQPGDLEVILDYGLDAQDLSTVKKLRENLRGA